MKDLEGDLEIFICFQVDINNMHFSLIPELRTTDAMYTLCQMQEISYWEEENLFRFCWPVIGFWQSI